MLSETLTGTAATWVIDWTRQHCHRGRLTRDPEVDRCDPDFPFLIRTMVILTIADYTST